ncbi:hypothetical protein JZ751_025403, partial [Albula glossodonta]
MSTLNAAGSPLSPGALAYFCEWHALIERTGCKGDRLAEVGHVLYLHYHTKNHFVCIVLCCMFIGFSFEDYSLMAYVFVCPCRTLGGLVSLGPSPSQGPGPLPLSPTSSGPPKVYPETWLPMESCQDFLQVPVSKEDRSYRTVYSLFHKTVSETRFRILKILRVQNPYLWEKYKRKKEYMSRKMSEMDRMLNERHLFHGTSQDVVEGICKHNFDPRVCGKHATMFGQGSYFARKAVYSHNFSKRSPKGVHCMFLAKVLTGKYTVGNPSMRRPPPLHPGNPSSDLFDSCVDNWVDPQIFVIFNDDQSYPYFIIQYEEVSNTVQRPLRAEPSPVRVPLSAVRAGGHGAVSRDGQTCLDSQGAFWVGSQQSSPSIRCEEEVSPTVHPLGASRYRGRFLLL